MEGLGTVLKVLVTLPCALVRGTEPGSKERCCRGFLFFLAQGCQVPFQSTPSPPSERCGPDEARVEVITIPLTGTRPLTAFFFLERQAILWSLLYAPHIWELVEKVTGAMSSQWEQG